MFYTFTYMYVYTHVYSHDASMSILQAKIIGGSLSVTAALESFMHANHEPVAAARLVDSSWQVGA